MNENQPEATDYGLLSYLHTASALNVETSLFARYSTLHFSPDWPVTFSTTALPRSPSRPAPPLGWRDRYLLNYQQRCAPRAG